MDQNTPDTGLREAAVAPPPMMSDAQLKAFGELAVRWTLEPKSRPTTAEELNQQLDAAGIPHDYYETFKIYERKDGEFSILLPERGLIETSSARFCNPDIDARPDKYDQLPEFYEEKAFKKEPDLAKKDMCEFYNLRVGDYCTGRCG